MKLSKNAKNAVLLGTLCSIAYLAVYFARNILSAVSAQMKQTGDFNDESIGVLLASFSIFYACGQLINGWLGDKLKARYMISLGLLLSAVTNAVYPFIAHIDFISIAVYGLTGFFLSFIYGPMTKVVSENTEPIHAVRCSLGYTFSSFFGSPLAGVVAMMASWQWAFGISSISLALMGSVCFLSFIMLEKRGIVKYNQYSAGKNQEKASVKLLIKKHQLIKFSLVSMITGIIRTSFVGFFTLYFAGHLSYSETEAEGMFSITTIAISAAAFISIFVYERIGRNMNLSLILWFLLAALGFGSLIFIHDRIANIVILVISVLASNAAATVLWSIYCPSLYKTGAVSTITGFLDFLSYMAAAAASIIFPLLVVDDDWTYVIIACFALMIIGLVISLPLKKTRAAAYEK